MCLKTVASSSVMLTNTERRIFGQLGLAQNVILSKCRCDKDLKELRKSMKKNEKRVVVLPRRSDHVIKLFFSLPLTKIS
jgi:hypothetical protein